MNWDWIRGNVGAIAAATVDHVVLTSIAVAVGFVVSLGFALLIHRDRRFYGPISGLTGVLYTIPSLALFALLLPITGLSLLPARIGPVTHQFILPPPPNGDGPPGAPASPGGAAACWGWRGVPMRGKMGGWPALRALEGAGSRGRNFSWT